MALSAHSILTMISLAQNWCSRSSRVFSFSMYSCSSGSSTIAASRHKLAMQLHRMSDADRPIELPLCASPTPRKGQTPGAWWFPVDASPTPNAGPLNAVGWDIIPFGHAPLD